MKNPKFYTSCLTVHKHSRNYNLFLKSLHNYEIYRSCSVKLILKTHHSSIIRVLIITFLVKNSPFVVLDSYTLTNNNSLYDDYVKWYSNWRRYDFSNCIITLMIGLICVTAILNYVIFIDLINKVWCFSAEIVQKSFKINGCIAWCFIVTFCTIFNLDLLTFTFIESANCFCSSVNRCTIIIAHEQLYNRALSVYRTIDLVYLAFHEAN